ncbi:hypothetical protein PoB_000421600 [Plakobranchus ocellatus]|uniref:Uncharacterized protein n=1 Tax=Plakobranchus ocellatus TaxID=259542 RepID=A0AAV3Y5K8_9GAST|nr:hypothetical protein PoB_000421600 [Plakobranchus ocellatus]
MIVLNLVQGAAGESERKKGGKGGERRWQEESESRSGVSEDPSSGKIKNRRGDQQHSHACCLDLDLPDGVHDSFLAIEESV